MKKLTDRKFERIANLILEADPMGLVSLGAPSDEYDAEANAIAVGLNADASIEECERLVFDVFAEYFGDSAPSKEHIRPLADRIHQFLRGKS